jgi:hypothetical protein
MAPSRIIGKADGRLLKGGLVLCFGKSNIVVAVWLVDVGYLLFQILAIAKIHLFNPVHTQEVYAQYSKIEQNCAANR